MDVNIVICKDGTSPATAVKKRSFQSDGNMVEEVKVAKLGEEGQSPKDIEVAPSDAEEEMGGKEISPRPHNLF